MSKRGLKKMALLLLIWVAMESCRLNAQTITGNVVTNNLTVTGDTITIGAQTGTTNPGWGAIYTDGTNSTVEFQGTRSGNTWEWQQSNGSILQMTLDYTNTLTLYNSSGTAVITLSPTGTSTFSSSVVISGTNNTMPNQTLTGSGSVLTEGLADSRYVSSSNIVTGSISGYFWNGTGYVSTAPTLGVNGGTASGAYSFAEGSSSTASGGDSMAMGQSTANGNYSTAMGQSTANGNYSTAMGQSTASGYFSTAMGQSTANGYFSTAMGLMSTASGQNSTAMGFETIASGQDSTAMGRNSTASGRYSTAMGRLTIASNYYATAMGWNSTASSLCATAMGNSTTASAENSTAMGASTTAQSFDELAIGRYNIGGGSSNYNWMATDPVFEIGNGTSTNAPSDALVVYKNGDMIVSGTNNTMPNQTLVNGNSVLTESLANTLYVSSSAITIGSAGGGPTVSLTGGTASGPDSFAEGNASYAIGPYSTAVGQSIAIGTGATAMGQSTASYWCATAMGHSTASGWYSTAMGCYSTASGYNSTAMGNLTTASGGTSTAMGYSSTASGNNSTAMGSYSTASGNWGSTAMGINSTASGNYGSTAMGKGSSASGNSSTAMGNSSTASGGTSTAMGGRTTASGYYSTAAGLNTTASAYDSFVIGTYNVGLNASGGTANTTAWVATDPLFEIGNGTAGVPGYWPTSGSGYYTWNPPYGSSWSSYSSYYGYYVFSYIPPVPAGLSDAFVVYKNGNAAVQGSLKAGGPICTTSLHATSPVTAPAYITTTQTGDIPMYTGN